MCLIQISLLGCRSVFVWATFVTDLIKDVFIQLGSNRIG